MDTADSGPYCMLLQNNENITNKIVSAYMRACVRVREHVRVCVDVFNSHFPRFSKSPLQ